MPCWHCYVGRNSYLCPLSDDCEAECLGHYTYTNDMMNDKKMKRYALLGFATALAMTAVAVVLMMIHSSEIRAADRAAELRAMAELDAELADALRRAEQEAARRDSLRGTLTDTAGVAMPGVVVSDGYTCTTTDSAGRYALHRHPEARFVYYTVPAYCRVPVHSATDSTALFYQAIRDTVRTYNFTLTRLPGGPETHHRVVVIGDPQATNALGPYFEGDNDNVVEKSDVARLADETMADIRQTIARWPADTPVYGISMGDDVQYYGGYNDSLEHQVRRVLGSTRMTVFSVIGNHDQDGKQIYREKWEENWGPTDYSFDRGDVHYVCFNNCDFYHGSLYYSPGELSDDQMRWLTQDLSLVDTLKKVVLCYHIPMTFGNRPAKRAEPLGLDTEQGHYASSRLDTLLTLLDRFDGGYELFCGHTHFALNHEITYHGRPVMERCHAAACGTIWQSNVNICGTPNGYYIYDLAGPTLAGSLYKPTRWDASQQMTLFAAAQSFNRESYARDWNLPRDSGTIVANVFNADSRWQVVAVENGREHPMTRLNATGQDAFAAGYHARYGQSISHWFVSKQNGYLIMNHLYYYTPSSPGAEFTIRATDPYGNVYTASSRSVVREPYFNFAHSYVSLPLRD